MTAVKAARESRCNAKPLKVELALDMLIRAKQEGRFVTTLDALQEFGDTCFHTTIAKLRERGVTFIQQPYQHTHRHGGTAHFQSYQLSEKSHAAAISLSQHYATMRTGGL